VHAIVVVPEQSLLTQSAASPSGRVSISVMPSSTSVYV